MNEVSSTSLRKGVAATLGSGASTQVGAAIGAHAFPLIGPAGVVAVRQVVAAMVLVPLARPDVRGMKWHQWWPTLLLGVIFAVMNLALYTSIDRVGLGLAVTLEFLGPLAVALIGSRQRRDLAIAACAGVGVYVLVLPGGSSDLLGIGLGLLAAGCWGAYIVLNRVVGLRLSGLQAPAIASTMAALIYLPVSIALVVQGRMTGPALAFAIGAGILSSAVPYATDLLVLRTVPPRLFGVLMSAQPALAALAGIALLGQIPVVHEWLGIAIVVAGNVAAVTLTQKQQRDPVYPEPDPVPV